NPDAAGPLGRWYLFKHLSSLQVTAASKYADIMRNFARYHLDVGSRSARSQSFQPVRGASDQELARREADGTMADYLRASRRADRQYRRVMAVLDQFADPVSGRNYVKDALDMLCCDQKEPNAAYRQNIAAVLSLIAKEFKLE